MYNLTRRADGTLRPPGELMQTATVSGKKVQLLVSPNVRAAAQAQLGCPGLAGAQLEEEGSAGSAGSHWEYTHYQVGRAAVRSVETRVGLGWERGGGG
jgi:leishmanolysin-like peptidase